MQTTRRRFLQAGASAAAAVAIAPSLTSAQSRRPLSENVLVVVQLSGGNDGLNTVVPFTSREYYAARPVIALAKRDLLPISADLAFHPSLAPLKAMFDAGHVAVLNGCGHPAPSRSHFRSLEIWHTGDLADPAAAGWLAGFPALNVGPYLPQALADSSPSVNPSDAGLASQLQLIAGRIATDSATRVYYAQLSGFDTHANQLAQHAAQLRQLSDSLVSFFSALRASNHADRVAVLCFSEFGRRLTQNNSDGTDHGTASPALVLGPSIRGGVYGPHPSLSNLDSVDLRYTTDFRRVYATLLDHWLGADSTTILKNRFEPLAFV